MNRNILILIVAVLSSCAVKTGNQFLEKLTYSEIREQIQKGVTTQLQVKSYYGEPQRVDITDNNQEKWHYVFRRESPKAINYVPVANKIYNGTNDTDKQLIIIFDQHNIVDQIAFTNSQGETKNGLFQ